MTASYRVAMVLVVFAGAAGATLLGQTTSSSSSSSSSASGGAQAATAPPVEMTVPAVASGDGDVPAIHGARVVGTTPGRPFLFLVPVTGAAPLKVSASKLPEGLVMEGGIIRGSVKSAGEYMVELEASNGVGRAARGLKIVAGPHKLALTPPMGWNSWNVWAGAVSQEKVKAAADAMVKSGLAAKGFSYINIDDCWEGKERTPAGEITTNERFPDMKGLADYVHAKGLKLGIYSSPGPKTCAKYLGSYEHEESDARTYAAWGIDYLKYDWCSYKGASKELSELKKPYVVMRQALDKADRDIVYSLCQYGMGNVAEWGGSPEVGGNLWRTTGDIKDTWGSMAGIGFKQGTISKFAKPGQWNDPDMLVVGKVGWGPKLHPTRLTPNEQLTHITLWSMLAAPLLIGCDMSDMDAFTTDLLTNSDVIGVDQDALGVAATRVRQTGRGEVWARPLADGTVAVALFNQGGEAQTVDIRWEELGAFFPKGSQRGAKELVRDLWQRKELGAMENGYSARVGQHGAVLIRVGAPVE